MVYGRNRANWIVSGTPPRRYGVFSHLKKVSFRRYGGKIFPDGIWDGRSRRRYARFLHNKKNSYRRSAGFIKCAAAAPKHKKNGVPSGSRYIFLCKIGADLLKLFKKKTFRNTPHRSLPSRIIKKWRPKKQLWNHFGVSSKNRIPIEIRSKNKQK